MPHDLNLELCVDLPRRAARPTRARLQTVDALVQVTPPVAVVARPRDPASPAHLCHGRAGPLRLQQHRHHFEGRAHLPPTRLEGKAEDTIGWVSHKSRERLRCLAERMSRMCPERSVSDHSGPNTRDPCTSELAGCQIRVRSRRQHADQPLPRRRRRGWLVLWRLTISRPTRDHRSTEFASWGSPGRVFSARLTRFPRQHRGQHRDRRSSHRSHVAQGMVEPNHTRAHCEMGGAGLEPAARCACRARGRRPPRLLRNPGDRLFPRWLAARSLDDAETPGWRRWRAGDVDRRFSRLLSQRLLFDRHP